MTSPLNMLEVSEMNLGPASENPPPNCTFMLRVAKYEFNISWSQPILTSKC